MDRLMRKIDDWDLPTGDLGRLVAPTSAIVRSASDTGPQHVASQNSTGFKGEDGAHGHNIPTIRIGRASDDVFGIEADGFRRDQVSILEKRMAIIETVSPVILGGLARGTAPGGGEWI
jgi:hypothetical protein